jgi:DNA repair exonuclease SbcCD ATPase subunit
LFRTLTNPMRLRSATVRNYRVHREIHVDFDDRRNLIGGPNESGKSTFVEAVHRALFLRAKTSGETQKQMVSEFGGHPEVAVTFECGAKEYRILKRFSGASGTATLTEIHGTTWSGEAAEARLAELLNVECVGGGRGAGDRAAQQWAHLWVWQGHAGNDPSEHANEQRESLLSRLQNSSGAGAVIMQSELDAQVATDVAAEHDGLFNKNGSPKANTELSRAIEEEARSKERLDSARAALERLQQAMEDVERADREIASAKEALDSLHAQKVDADKKLARVAELQAAEKTQVIAAESAAEKQRALQDADRQIAALRTDAAKRTAASAAEMAERLRLGEVESAAKKRQGEAEESCRAATKAMRITQQRHEAAAAYVSYFEKRTICDQLKVRCAQVQQLSTELRALEAKLAELPAISAAKLKSLTNLETARGHAQAALTAMAAGIQVVAADQPVIVGDAELPTGTTRVITDDTEIVIGKHTRLRISPGGGTTLAAARNQCSETEDALQRELSALGVKSLADATEAFTRRDQIESDIRTQKARMEGCGADAIAQELRDAEGAVAVNEADARRRFALVEGFSAPADATAAATLVSAIAVDLRELETKERAAEASLDDARAKLESAVNKVAEHRQRTEKERDVLTSLDAQIRLLLETHGSDEARTVQLQNITGVSRDAASVLAATRQSLAALQPDLLSRERERLERSIQQNTHARFEAERNRAVAQNTLRSDGSNDPRENAALAEAAHRASMERTATARRSAEAIRLLASLFSAEQRALAQQFTQPLAEKISMYLQCLFGAEAQVQMTLEDHRFTGLRITRSGETAGAISFSALSGGAREQVAAAVRLGMAEVLASAHAGVLPVVFDDAFAYADPARVQILQRMLDLAAHRGLQVIVLTCTPSDYAGFGARTISFVRNATPLRPSAASQLGSEGLLSS